jgi:hypothetical protein
LVPTGLLIIFATLSNSGSAIIKINKVGLANYKFGSAFDGPDSRGEWEYYDQTTTLHEQ